MVSKSLKRAVTLAELIIVIVVVGVIGAITLGVLRMNTSDVEYNVAKAKMMDSISTALGTMQLDNNLAGYNSTDEFANVLQKYYSAEKMSSSEVPTSKIPDEVKSALGDDTVYLKGQNGEILAVSYNKDYTPASQYTQMAQTDKTTATNSVDFRNESMNAVSGFYDVNGLNVGPNKTGVDIYVIEPYAEGTEGNCSGNFVPNSGGACMCSVTATECVSMGRTFNVEKCACEVNCPVGKVYSEEAGQCVCSLNKNSCSPPYSTFDEESCTCKTIMGAGSKCQENGGIWDEDAATCKCPATTDKNSCERKSGYYAYADPKNFCKCTCHSKEKIDSMVAQKASGRPDEDVVKRSTIVTENVDEGCFVCASTPADVTTYTIEKENGMCVTKGLVSQDPSCVPPFCQWVGFPYYYNKCTLTQDACDNILDKAHKEYFGYEARSNSCMTDTYDSCRANVDACIANPHSQACKNGIKNCSNATSTPHYGCSMNFHSSWKNTVVNGGLTPVKPKGVGPSANATVNNCYCSVKQGVINASVPRETHFHGAYGIAEANRYTKFTGYSLPAFKGAYMDSQRSLATPINNVMVLESYISWYDPIVLNVNAASEYSTPKTTDSIDVPFKNYEGNDILTAWIASYTEPSYYFLVNDRNKNNKVDDLSELYSEAGGLVTGLQMLNEDFGEKATAKTVISYPKLARKGLKTWADMNSNAVVDSSDVWEDLLVLTAEKVVVEEQRNSRMSKRFNYVSPKTQKVEYKFVDISGTGVFEIYTGYTLISDNKDGTPLRSGNSTIAIQSKYSILKPIDKLSSSKYWVQIVPTEAGTNPSVKYVTEDGKNVTKSTEVYQNNINKNLYGVDKLVWEYSFTPAIYTQKPIALYIDVDGQYYEVQVRGLTDIIFDKK